MDEAGLMMPPLVYSKSFGTTTCYGSCEYCGTYNSVLKLIKLVTTDRFLWTDKQYQMYTQPFWCCNYCQAELSRTKTPFRNCGYMIREEPIDKRLLESGHIRNILIRKMKALEDIFPKEIDGIFILPARDVPKKFSKKTNIIISFKDLSLLKYFRYVLDRDVCLMHTWDDNGSSTFGSKAKFWRVKDSRILIALGRIHAQSDYLSIWVWADTRIVSIEFFCKTPVEMTQVTPAKILRVV